MDRFERLFLRWREAEDAAVAYACAHRDSTAPHRRFIAAQLAAVARLRYGCVYRELLASRRKLPLL